MRFPESSSSSSSNRVHSFFFLFFLCYGSAVAVLFACCLYLYFLETRGRLWTPKVGKGNINQGVAKDLDVFEPCRR
jgi:hypothetical protein